MTVPVQNPRTDVVADGTTTTFNYAFLCLLAEDMAVLLDGTPLPQNAYTVGGLGNPNGGTVTIQFPPANGVIVTMALEVVLRRTADYRTLGDLFASTLNRDFDRIWLALQGRSFDLSRALRLGDEDVDGSGSYRANNNRIQDLGDPQQDQDAVNRRTMWSYVDQAIAGVVGGFGYFLQAGVGAVMRTFQDKMRDTISAKDFGVVGDGVANDTVAMQRFLDAAAGRNGYLPAGTYLCGTLIVRSRTRLYGDSQLTTIIKAAPTLAGNAALMQNEHLSGLVGVYDDKDIRLEDVCFDGSGLGSRTAELVSFGKVERPSFTRCKVTNVGYIGLAIGGCAYPRVMNCHFDKTGNPVETAEGGPALWFGSAADTTPSQFGLVLGCSFENLEWAGIYGSCHRLKIIGCDFNAVKEAAIFTGQIRGLIISGNHINGVTRKHISASGIETGASYVAITGNTIANVQNCHIALTDTQLVTISGNTLLECRQDPTFYPQASGIGIVSESPDGSSPEEITIVGNTFSSAATLPYAFVVGGGTGAALKNISIQGNNCTPVSYVSGRSVYFATGKRGINCVSRNNIGTADGSPVVGKFTTNATTGNQAISGLGFKPSRIEMHAIITSSSLLSVCNSVINSAGVGYYDCTASSGSTGYSFSPPTPGAAALQLINSAGTTLCAANLVSLDEDGFTLNITTATNQAIVRYVAYP